MTMTVISLTRIVASGVAIHAARMMEYRRNGFKRRSRSRIVMLRGRINVFYCLGTFIPLRVRPKDRCERQTAGQCDRDHQGACLA
jgi:hypothetical protein